MNGPNADVRRHRPIGYLVVAGGCLLLHNAIMIAADALGLPLWAAVLASFVIVASAGYLAHCRLTFRERISASGFVRYAGAMTANVPVAYALVWLLRYALGLPMVLAAPASSLMMLVLNYALSRWAIVPARPQGNCVMTASTTLDPLDLQAILSRHLPMYRSKVPHYQTHMLDSLREVWSGRHESLLDVGGGTGVIAEAIAALFPVGRVRAIDLVDRFCTTLSVETAQYDGRTMPFAAGSFDAATLNNVLHHVPVSERAGLLREIRRVVAGPLYIKDHASLGRIDDVRLTTLDAIGNIPFGGMIKAQYLSPREWSDLAAASGWQIAQTAATRRYRAGPMAALFPNRLEITLRLDPA